VNDVSARFAGTALLVLFAFLGTASAQFRDDFTGPSLKIDPDGVTGWGFATGEGRAVMDLKQGDGCAVISVDATADRRNVWWALIVRRVSDGMDLAQLRKPGRALRVEARIRVSHAPRRVNLHLNTQRTTDFHSHLMEFDIPDTENWHTISMTTRDFDAGPGDVVNGQMALMDWGSGKYRVDVDYFKVDIVDAATAGPDKGNAVLYHPPIPDPASFAHDVPVAHDAMIDGDDPDANLNDWIIGDGDEKARVLSVSGTRFTILRWDLSAFAGKRVSRHGLLELTTRSVARTADKRPDFGELRVVEIAGGDPLWDQKTVTRTSFLRGAPVTEALNTQMIIDYPPAESDGGKTYLTISKYVLQRLIDGRTLGIAVRPLGALDACFYASEEKDGRFAPRLRFDLEERERTVSRRPPEPRQREKT
jgi:hypothetical protein